MSHFYLFLLMAVLLVIMPGPDTGLVTKNTLTQGNKGGGLTLIGITLGLLIHTSAASLGLSALLLKSSLIFNIFKYIGALYLVYLGLMSFRDSRKQAAPISEDLQSKEPKRQGSCLMQGFLTNVLNPKVAVFFLTFLPQFISSGGNPFFQFLGMGIIYILITIIWLLIYIRLIDWIRNWMNKPSTQRIMHGMTGVVLFLFGIKLALEKQ